MARFHLRPQARHWLRAPSVEPEPGGPGDPDAWMAWALGRMARGAILEVGGVLVDRAVLEQRFGCVPGRCAPGDLRGRSRSCCADLDVALSPAEVNRLRRHSRRLGGWLARREPRLGVAQGPRGAAGQRPFWLAADGAHLARPTDPAGGGARCVFSRLDRQGRIRCHLHGYARAQAIELAVVQPLPCRLFPLVLVSLPTAGVLLTVLSGSTSRLVGTLPAPRFPCLADPNLPEATRSLAPELDWLFGRGFARALR